MHWLPHRSFAHHPIRSLLTTSNRRRGSKRILMATGRRSILPWGWFLTLSPLAISYERTSHANTHSRNATAFELSTIEPSFGTSQVYGAANFSGLNDKNNSFKHMQRRELLNEPEVELQRLPAVRIEWTRSKDSVGWSSSNDPHHATAAKCINPAPFGQQVSLMSIF